MNECPGCGAAKGGLGCDNCEYDNLVSGRSHYCGDDDCYCANLRKFMRRDVLNSFAPRESP